MAIIRTYLETRKDGVRLYKKYSNNGYKIIQNETGRIFYEAVDVETTKYTYTETTEKIDDKK
jgi:hypothetical protein